MFKLLISLLVVMTLVGSTNAGWFDRFKPKPSPVASEPDPSYETLDKKVAVLGEELRGEDTKLSTRVDSVEVTTKEQTEKLNNLKVNFTNMNIQMDQLTSTVGTLEQTKHTLRIGIRVVDTKRFSAGVEHTFDLRRSKADRVGVTILYKLGTSYEERLVQTEINKLRKALILLEKIGQLREELR